MLLYDAYAKKYVGATPLYDVVVCGCVWLCVVVWCCLTVLMYCVYTSKAVSVYTHEVNCTQVLFT